MREAKIVCRRSCLLLGEMGGDGGEDCLLMVELGDKTGGGDEEEDDPGLGDIGLGLNGCGGKHSEFTLGMDIPEPFGMGMGGRRYDHEEWISVANANIPSR